MGVLSKEAVVDLGFKYISPTARLSDKASFYGCENIEIGDYVRIDDYCVISAGQGGVKIGRNVHIAIYSSLVGRGTIVIDDFVNLSSRVSIYSSNDDYSGSYMTNPTIPEKYTNVDHSSVTMGKHVIIGSGSVILPGTNLGEGVAVGALSLLKGSYGEFTVYAGVPAKKIGERSRQLRSVEREFMNENSLIGK